MTFKLQSMQEDFTIELHVKIRFFDFFYYLYWHFWNLGFGNFNFEVKFPSIIIRKVWKLIVFNDMVISCQIYLNNNTDIPKCKWSRKCWGFLFWTLTSFTSHQSSSSIWLPDKWFFSRHHFRLEFKIWHSFKLYTQLPS